MRAAVVLCFGLLACENGGQAVSATATAVTASPDTEFVKGVRVVGAAVVAADGRSHLRVVLLNTTAAPIAVPLGDGTGSGKEGSVALHGPSGKTSVTIPAGSYAQLSWLLAQNVSMTVAHINGHLLAVSEP